MANSSDVQRNQQNNTSINNIGSDNNENNDNNEVDRMFDIFTGLNFLLNISRLKRAQYDDEDNSMRIMRNEQNDEEGPAMTYEELQAFPSSTYPRNINNSTEKCDICYFDFCYNDVVTKLRCNHTFHKNCLVNRLSTRNSGAN